MITALHFVRTIIGIISLGVGLGMLLSQNSPPSFMPVLLSWQYLLVGVLLFVSGFVVVVNGEWSDL